MLNFSELQGSSGFAGSSVGKEFACNAGDPSLVAQLVKNLPAMQETLVQLLGWEDPLEEG